MVLRIERRRVDGPAGTIEVALDVPSQQPARGLAFVCHPHPLHGGTLDNKVTATLARAFASAGWLAIRFNFRGVGDSAGVHDKGMGETDDLLYLIDNASRWLGAPVESPPRAGEAPLALAGFSFGSFVAARAATALAARGKRPRHLVLVGVAAGKWPLPPVAADTLVIHGEHDETIPLAAVFDWARPQELPVTVLPGADHFFHRRLTPLKRLVLTHLSAPAFDAAVQTD